MILNTDALFRVTLLSEVSFLFKALLAGSLLMYPYVYKYMILVSFKLCVSLYHFKYIVSEREFDQHCTLSVLIKITFANDVFLLLIS